MVAGLFSLMPFAAASVDFYTAGGFFGPNSSTGNLLFSDATGTASTAVYFGGGGSSGVLTGPGTYTDVDFGQFSVQTTGTPGVEYLQPGNSFSIVLIQTAPTSNYQYLGTSFLTGTISSSAGGLLVLGFDPAANSASFDNGAETYTLNTEYDIPIDANGNATFTLTGTVNVVPEPSTWAMMLAAASLLIMAQRFRRMWIA